MRNRCLSLLCIALTTWGIAQAPPTRPRARGARIADPAQNLLAESAAYSSELLPEERGWLLFRLSEVARKVSAAESAEFARRSFVSASEMPTSWNRIALQKNAVTALSQVDPVAAMKLLGTIGSPVSAGDGSYPEDSRDSAAKILFPEYYEKEGLKGLATLRTAALQLGATGQYPHEAVGIVTPEIYKKSKDRALQLASDSIHAYQLGGKFRRENTDFLVFLRHVHDLLPFSMLKEAVALAFDRLESDRSKPQPGFVGRLVTSRGSAPLSNPSSELLIELLPLLEETDPDLAAKTLKQDDELRTLSGLGNEGLRSESATIYGTESDRSDPVSQTRGIEASRLSTITRLSDPHPEQALTQANSLTIPEYRIEGLAAAAAGFAATDPQLGRQPLQDTFREMQTLKDEDAKLTAADAVARAAIVLKDQQILVKALEIVYSLGEELFEEDSQSNPVAAAYTRPGFEELVGTTRFLAWNDFSQASDRVRAVRNSIVRAYLLAELAEGLADKRLKLNPPSIESSPM